MCGHVLHHLFLCCNCGSGYFGVGDWQYLHHMVGQEGETIPSEIREKQIRGGTGINGKTHRTV